MGNRREHHREVFSGKKGFAERVLTGGTPCAVGEDCEGKADAYADFTGTGCFKTSPGDALKNGIVRTSLFPIYPLYPSAQWRNRCIARVLIEGRF
jgi:hypothetical protein